MPRFPSHPSPRYPGIYVQVYKHIVSSTKWIINSLLEFYLSTFFIISVSEPPPYQVEESVTYKDKKLKVGLKKKRWILYEWNKNDFLPKIKALKKWLCKGVDGFVVCWLIWCRSQLFFPAIIWLSNTKHFSTIIAFKLLF